MSNLKEPTIILLMSASQPATSLCIKDEKIIALFGDYELALPYHKSILAVVCFFLSHLKDSKTGRRVFSYQSIASGLGYNHRQWAYGILSQIKSSGYNLVLYYQGRIKLDETILSLVSSLVYTYPLYNISKLHRLFLEHHPNYTLSRYQFVSYVKGIDTVDLLSHLRKQLQVNALNLNMVYYLNLILSKPCDTLQRAYIQELLPSLPCQKAKKLSISAYFAPIAESDMILSYLYVCGCSLADLGRLFGMAKSTIHKRIYRFANHLERVLPQAIQHWSGSIHVDEKWIKIKGQWQYVLSAVDAQSGLPLLSMRMPSLDAYAWATFFFEFESIYGKPKTLISDGCTKIAKAKKMIWQQTKHQLCWFHKLKNLTKRIYETIEDQALMKRALRLAKGAFRNASISARKRALKKLQQIAPKTVQTYITKSLLNQWRKLTKAWTNNAAERYNRKIQKAIAPRYGIKNEDCAHVLIQLVWFKDLLCHANEQVDNELLFGRLFPKQYKKSTKIIHFNVNELVKSTLKQAS